MLSATCAVCRETFFYRREGEQLFYDLSCGCKELPPYPLSWQMIADSINSQKDPEIRQLYAGQFGLILEPHVEPERNGHGGLPDFEYLKDGLTE